MSDVFYATDKQRKIEKTDQSDVFYATDKQRGSLNSDMQKSNYIKNTIAEKRYPAKALQDSLKSQELKTTIPSATYDAGYVKETQLKKEMDEAKTTYEKLKKQDDRTLPMKVLDTIGGVPTFVSVAKQEYEAKKKEYEDYKDVRYYSSIPNGEAKTTNKNNEVYGTNLFSKVDWEYEYINDSGSLRDTVKAQSVRSGGGNSYELYDYMTDREIGIYNYLYSKKGKDEAKEFLKFIEDDLETRLSTKNMEKAQKFADEHPYISAALSIPMNVMAAGEQVVNTADYLLTGDMNRNMSADSANILRGALPEKVSWEIKNWDAFDFIYNTTMSAADSLVMAPFGTVGAVSLGLSAAASSTNDILDRGGTAEQAFWGGVAAGVFEGFFEKFSIGQLKSMQEGTVKGFKDFTTNLVKSMATNFSEETATEVANILYDYAANGGISNYSIMVEEFIANGDSPEKAKKKAAEKLGLQVLEAGASGALMGAGFAAIGSASGYNNYKNAALPNIIERLANDEEVSVDEINKIPQIKKIAKSISEREETYTIDTPERNSLRQDVANKLLNNGSYSGVDESGKEVYNGNVKQEQRADIVIGLSAAGKSSVLVNPLSEMYSSRIIDSDMAKEELPEFDNGLGANAVHRESQGITEDTLLKSIKNGDNIVHPIVGGNIDSLIDKIQFLKDYGYSVHLHLNELSNNKALGRALNRFLETGRYIPPEVIKAYGDTPTQNFNIIINTEGLVDGYSHYSNDVERGQHPKLIKISENDRQFDERLLESRRNSSKSPSNGIETTKTESPGTTESVNTKADPNGPANFMSGGEFVEGERHYIYAPEQDFIKSICDKLGVKMKFIDITPELLKENGYNVDEDNLPDGFYDRRNQTLYIGFNVTQPVKFILKHELTHFLEINQTKYADLANAIMDSKIFKKWVKSLGYNSVSEYNSSIVAQYSVTDKTFGEHEANLEMVANFVGTNMFGDKNQIERLVEGFNATQRSKFAQFIHDFLFHIRTKLKREVKIDEELKALEEQYVKLLSDVVKENKTENSGDLKFSINAVTITEANIEQNIADIVNMESVAELSGKEFSKGEKDLVSQVDEYFAKFGSSVENSVLGDVDITARGAKDSIAHGIGRNKAVAFAAVPNVIKNGKIIDYQTNWKSRGYDTVVLAAPVNINNQPYYEGVIVIRDSKTQRFYVHEVITEKRTDMSFKTGADNKVGKSGDISSPSIISLLDKIRVVKEKMTSEEVDNNNSMQESGNNSKSNLKFTFARPDNMSLVKKAEQMEKELKVDNINEEEIRKRIWIDIGLVRDAAGEWVYEISDNKLKFDLYRKTKLSLEAKEFIKLGIAQTRTKEMNFRYNELYQKYQKEPLYKGKLSDFVVHDKLFAKFPTLNDVNFEICFLPDGTYGQYDVARNTIQLDCTMILAYEMTKKHHYSKSDIEICEKRIKRTLVHEMQHVVQIIEGRETGSNIETWNQRLLDKNFKMPINPMTGEEYTPEAAYWFTKGEYEAREVEDRLEMDDETRRYEFLPDLGWGKTISAKQPVTASSLKFSIPTNSEYMSAVKSNDTAKLQEMVDNKARAAGYTERLYHQTGADFNEFNTDNQKAGKYDWELPTGTFLKPSKEDIGLEGKKQMELYAKIQKPLSFKDRTDAQRFWRKNIPEYKKAADNVIKIDLEYREKVNEAMSAARRYLKEWKQNNPDSNSRDIYKDSEYLRLKDIEDSIVDEWESKSDEASLEAKKLIDKFISENDYDGIIVEKDQDGIKHQTKTYIVFNSNQLKDAAPVTYDDNGDVISLSQRFDEGKKDIRFSVPSVISPEILLERYENGEITRQEYLDMVKKQKPSNPIEIANMKEENANTTPPLKRKQGESDGDKESKFYGSIQDSSLFDEEFKREAAADSFIEKYKSVTNKETLEKAARELDEGGLSYVLEWNNTDPEHASLIDTAVGFILMDRYQRIGDYESAAAAAERVRMFGTAGGQQIQIFSILGRLDPNSMQVYAQHTLDKAFEKLADVKTKKWIESNKDKFELTDEDIEFIRRHTLQAALFEDGTRPKAVALGKICARIQDKIPPEAGDSIRALQRDSMLLNLRTNVRNVTGNAGMVGVFVASDVFGSGIDKIIAKKTGVRTTGNFDIKSVSGLKKGLYESYDDFKRGIRTKQEELNRFDMNTRHSSKSFNDNGEGLFGTGALKKQLNDIAKFLNKMDNFTSFCLEAGDRPFFEMWYMNSLNTQKKLNNADVPTLEMMEVAKQEALQRTWQDDSKFTRSASKIKSALNDMVHIPGTSYGLGDFVMKFIKTPSNIAKAIVSFSPVGFISAGVNAKKLKNAIDKGKFTPQLQKEFVRSMSNAVTGTLLYTLVAVGASLGIIKLSGDEDDDKDASNYEKYIMGISPYSIEFLGVNIPYDWAQPFGSVLAVVADFMDSQKQNTDGDTADAILEAIKAGGKAFAQQSFLQSLYDLFSSEDIVEALTTAALAEPAAFIPQRWSQTASFLDEYRRTSYDATSSFASAINKVIAKIPGLRTTLPKQVNILGEDVKNTQYLNVWEAFASPWNTYPKSTNEVVGEIYDLYKATGENSVMPRTAPNDFTVKGIKIVFTPEEKAEFQRNIGKRSAEMLGLLFDSNEYKNLSDDEKVKVIGKIYQFAYDKAKSEREYDYATLSAMAGEKKNGDPSLTEVEYNRLPQKAREMIAQEHFLSKTEVRYIDNYKSLIQWYIRQAKE